MSLRLEHDNVVLRVEWSKEVSIQLISTTNPSGIINNSDLQTERTLLQWIVLKHIAPTRHRSALAQCNNTPAVSWPTRMSLNSDVEAQLVRALALR